MPGTNAGTGQPLSFRCWKCRRRDARRPEGPLFRGGYCGDVVLTGRSKTIHDGRAGPRSSNLLVEYSCTYCQHTGWSRHVELERRFFKWEAS